MVQKIIEQYAAKQNLLLEALTIDGFCAYRTKADHLPNLLKFVQNDTELRFTILTDLFAADFPNKTKRFELVYQLLSLQLNKRLLFKIELAPEETAISIASLYKAACWYEREIFDMFGVHFTNSPDLRRILTDYGFTGHPLRKDFPLTGHLQVKYDEKMEKVIYEPVLLEQEFRNFDFTSPWQGPIAKLNQSPYAAPLPGDEKAKK